ncbi:MAG TPA: hypothetical protein VEK08_12080 [Planctomycetota bacterium]|nr:hypothetical protein [Planctomycetota bacterium]
MKETNNAWTINALLAVILVLLCAVYFNASSKSAHAAGGGWDTDGVMALTTAADNERLILVDTKKMNIMVYKPLGNKFNLVGARNYEYDVQIEDSEGTQIEKGNGKTYMEIFRIYHELKNAPAKKP